MMMTRTCLFALTLGLAFSSAARSQTYTWVKVFELPDPWKFFKGTVTPPPEWTQVDFDDGAWFEDPSGYGYDDDAGALTNINTRITDMQGSYATLYFRKTFRIDNLAQVGGVRFRFFYEDGYIAYVNGREVGRSKMPTGAVTHETLATTPAIDRTSGTTGAQAALLVEGDNVIAFEVHNVSLTSSDLIFEPTLLEMGVLPEPVKPKFKRMDVDGNGKVAIEDVLKYLTLYLFGSEKTLTCPDAADANDDGQTSLTDAIYIASFIFFTADKRPPAKAPYPDCGEDPTSDELDKFATDGKGCVYPETSCSPPQ